MYNAGRNKTKVFFYDREELEEVVNEVGEYEQKPKLICVDWVELLPQTGREFIKNRKDEHEMTYRFKMRSRKDIEVNDYVVFNDIKAEIIYIGAYMDYVTQGRYMEVVVLWQS
ncbi:head-tail adaptor [Peptoniphilus olsenii]|uniref:Head-tail adaptor n=1 Tax=Peptoniphilus olsenii TaxID=411570 RepID=A0ABV2J7L0_9FIRM